MVGYNDKMRTLLETVIGKIAEFEVRVDRFSVIKVVDNSSLQNCMFFCVSFSPVVDMPRTLEEPELGMGIRSNIQFGIQFNPQNFLFLNGSF